MSEHLASTMTAPAPEKDPAAPVEQTEQETVGTEKPLVERAREIRALEPTVGSFRKLLGDAYADLLPADADTDTELSDVAKNVFEFEKSRLYAAMADELVDGDTFKRATVAFPENPKAGKTAYIIDDLKSALSDTTDPTFKKNLEESILHMENFAKIVSEDDNNLDDTFLKRYLELANDPKADQEELKAAKASLMAFQEGNIVKYGAYKVIALYFPSEKAKQQLKLADARVSLRPDKVLGVDYSQEAPASETTNVKIVAASQSREAITEDENLVDRRKWVAKNIAGRINSRKPYGMAKHDMRKGKTVDGKLYDNDVMFAFEEQNKHLPEGEQRREALFTHIKTEAARLEKMVNELRTRPANLEDPSQTITTDIQKKIEQVKQDPYFAVYTEDEIFNKVQSEIHKSFEEIIKAERYGKKQRVLAKAALGIRATTAALPATADLVFSPKSAPRRIADKATAVKDRIKDKAGDERTIVGRGDNMRKKAFETLKESYRKERERLVARAALRRPRS